MTKYLITKKTLTEIGNAIRRKSGNSERILVSDIPKAILDIPQEGSEQSIFYIDSKNELGNKTTICEKIIAIKEA